MTTQLTDHFTLEELTASDTADAMGIDNTPGPDEEACLSILAETLELVRVILNDNPMIISSGYRCYALNVACGGADDSAHLSGLAADFTCPDFGTPLEICNALEPHMESLGIDQLIWEYEGWVHLGLTAGDPALHGSHDQRERNNHGVCMKGHWRGWRLMVLMSIDALLRRRHDPALQARRHGDRTGRS